MDKNIDDRNYYTDNFIKKDVGSAAKNRKSSIIKKMVNIFNHNDLKNHFLDSRRSISDFDKPFKYPDSFTAYRIKTHDFSIELLESTENNKSDNKEVYNIEDKDFLENKNKSWVVFQIHGGGYINAFKNQYRSMAKLYAKQAGDIDVLSIDYRVAPENVYPAALEDVVASFEWLLEAGYTEEHIIVAGDSAGGGLALALCHFLRDNNRKLPSGLICMSPWTDLTLSGDSYRYNFEVDDVFGNLEDSIICNNPYPHGEDLKNPYISPLFGDFTGFPAMLIQVGTNEMLLDDSVRLVHAARNADVKVRFSQYEDMFHVFQLSGMVLEESKNAWEEIGQFIKMLKMKEKLTD